MAYEATSNAGGVGTATQVVVGLFKNASDAHQAVTELREQGFGPGQIGAAFRGRESDSYLDPSDAGAVSGEAVNREHENWWEKVKDAFRSDDNVERRRESREAVADTSFQPETYSRGDYEYDLANDEFEDSLVGTGIPSARAAYLTRSLEPGGAIVTVHDANRGAEAEQILSANHARVRYEDIRQNDDVVGDQVLEDEVVGTEAERIDAADSTGQEITDTGYVDRRPVDAETRGVDRVQLFGEVLRVHKERINQREVRVRKDVVTENQTIEVPVMREELVLERVSVSGNTPASSASIGRSQEIRVPLSEEKVRLEKQPVVREEVNVGKREVADVEKVSADVRREELRVDPDPEIRKRSATGEELAEDVRRHG
jgi:uncharacterized protein (TIGR02271 family)